MSPKAVKIRKRAAASSAVKRQLPSDADNDDAPPEAVSFNEAKRLALDAADVQRRRAVAGEKATRGLLRDRRRERQEANRMMKKKKTVKNSPVPPEPLPDFIPLHPTSTTAVGATSSDKRALASKKKQRALVESSRDGRVKYVPDPGRYYLAGKLQSAAVFKRDRFEGKKAWCAKRGQAQAKAYVGLQAKLAGIRRLTGL